MGKLRMRRPSRDRVVGSGFAITSPTARIRARGERRKDSSLDSQSPAGGALRIGIASICGPVESFGTWSGTPAHLTRELASREVDVVNLPPPSAPLYWVLH